VIRDPYFIVVRENVHKPLKRAPRPVYIVRPALLAQRDTPLNIGGIVADVPANRRAPWHVQHFRADIAQPRRLCKNDFIAPRGNARMTRNSGVLPRRFQSVEPGQSTTPQLPAHAARGFPLAVYVQVKPHCFPSAAAPGPSPGSALPALARAAVYVQSSNKSGGRTSRIGAWSLPPPAGAACRRWWRVAARLT